MTKFDFNAWLEVDDKIAKALWHETNDADWSQYGRVINSNIERWSFVQAINRASLKAKSMSHLAALIRAYLQTGALP